MDFKTELFIKKIKNYFDSKVNYFPYKLFFSFSEPIEIDDPALFDSSLTIPKLEQAPYLSLFKNFLENKSFKIEPSTLEAIVEICHKKQSLISLTKTLAHISPDSDILSVLQKKNQQLSISFQDIGGL